MTLKRVGPLSCARISGTLAATQSGASLLRPGCPWRSPADRTAAGAPATQERKAFRMLDRLEAQVDVQPRPMEMLPVQQLDVQDARDGGILEPGKLLEGEKELLVADEDPEAMLGDVGDLNARNVLSTRRGSHAHVSERGMTPPTGAFRSCRSSARAQYSDPARTWLRPPNGGHGHARAPLPGRRSRSGNRRVGRRSDSPCREVSRGGSRIIPQPCPGRAGAALRLTTQIPPCP